jgi:hypothetical protein
MEHAVKIRRHLTPPMGVPTFKGAHAMRRGGARREVSERVTLDGSGGVHVEGWALNVSRGGVRVILEETVQLGQEFMATVGEMTNSPLQRRARVVWVQEERDGVVVGLEFIGLSGQHRSAPPGPLGDAPKPPGTPTQ